MSHLSRAPGVTVMQIVIGAGPGSPGWSWSAAPMRSAYELTWWTFSGQRMVRKDGRTLLRGKLEGWILR